MVNNAAYLVINVEGDGDTYVKVVNHDAFKWIIVGGPIPKDQKDLLIARIMDAIYPKENEWKRGTEVDWLKDATESMAQLDKEFDGVYADQERAMFVMSSSFEGKIFDEGYVNISSAVKFIQDNGLVLVDEFRGLSW